METRVAVATVRQLLVQDHHPLTWYTRASRTLCQSWRSIIIQFHNLQKNPRFLRLFGDSKHSWDIWDSKKLQDSVRCYTFSLQHSLLEEIFESYTFSPLRCSLDLLHQCTLAQENQLHYPEEIRQTKKLWFHRNFQFSQTVKLLQVSKKHNPQGPQAMLQSTSILGLVHSIRHTANLRALVKGSKKLPYKSNERERYITYCGWKKSG